MEARNQDYFSSSEAMKGSTRYVHLGDMGFQSSLPWVTGQFQKCQPHPTSFLFMKLHRVKRSKNQASSMDRFGGENFTVESRGGCRNQANCLVKIQAKNLVLAVSLCYEFFENRFTSLVFGAERCINDSWDGINPESFLEMVSI